MTVLTVARGSLGEMLARRSSRLPRPAVDAALLALPLVLVVVLTRHLTVGIVTFHWTDERLYHLPVVRQFAASWPAPHWADYNSATGPLFHWLTAGWGRLVGEQVWKLRAFDLLLSWAASITFCTTLRRAGAGTVVALTGAAALALSPYVFGVSFLVMTDNLALLLSALMVLGLQTATRRPAAGLALATVALGLVCLTRQSSAWLVVPFLLYGWRGRPAARQVLLRGAAAAVALVPLGVLVLMWHGLLPPRLGAEHQGGLAIRNAVFGLAVLGALTPLLVAQIVPLLRAGLRRAVAGGLLGLVVALAVPLRRGTHDDGWLWRVAEHTPVVAGVSAVFLVLVPLAGACLAVLSTSTRARPALVTLAVFLLSLAGNQTDYQKYSEPILLAGLLLYVASDPDARPRERRLDRVALLVTAGFAALGFAYFVLQTHQVL